MRQPLLILFSLLAALCPLGAQQATARTEASQYAIGDWIPVHVDLVHPKGAQITLQNPEALEGFQLITPLKVARQDDTHSTGTLVVARYEGGVATLPVLTLNCLVPGDKTPQTLTTKPLTFSIQAVNVDTSQGIKDLKAPLTIPWTIAEIALIALVGLAILAAIYGAYCLWRRFRARPGGATPPPPPRPAHLVALEELDALRAKKLWQQGLVKEHHSEATEILRRYFEARFRILALEQTTDEILEALRQRPDAEPIRAAAEPILRLADLVKFAKYQPVAAEHEQVVDGAQEIVQKSSESC